jgi:hypothetical protein
MIIFVENTEGVSYSQGVFESNVVNLKESPFIPNPNKKRFCLSVGILFSLQKHIKDSY